MVTTAHSKPHLISRTGMRLCILLVVALILNEWESAASSWHFPVQYHLDRLSRLAHVLRIPIVPWDLTQLLMPPRASRCDAVGNVWYVCG
jgi:hypothetical protein